MRYETVCDSDDLVCAAADRLPQIRTGHGCNHISGAGNCNGKSIKNRARNILALLLLQLRFLRIMERPMQLEINVITSNAEAT